MLVQPRLPTSLLPLLFVCACGPLTASVPVLGTELSVSELIGEWRGEYQSEDTGRHGTIMFRLHPVVDTAQGVVFMETKPHGAAPGLSQRLEPPATETVPLFIRFVVIEGGAVRGRLDPYKDPECGCTLTTTFDGRLQGEVISGTFASSGSGIHHIPASGRWSVTRVSR
jgi:hypothetical protein